MGQHKAPMMARLGPAGQTDKDAQILSGAVKLVLIIGMECMVRKYIGLR